MAVKSTSIYIDEALIKRLEERARQTRRSRNSLFIEGVEMVLESFDQAEREQTQNNKQKAGKQK
jgi:predicted transcriptional regulator